MRKYQFSLRWLLAGTALFAALVAGGIRIMPEADRQNPEIVWVGPVFLALAILAGVLSCVAVGRFFGVIYEALGACREIGARRIKPPKS